MTASPPPADPANLHRLRARRKSLLFSCAIGTCLAFALHADPARAQAINATPTTASGNVTYSRNVSPTPGSETITVNTSTAIINWQPPSTTTDPYIFLPAGNTVTFQNGPVADFAVLNRIFSNVPAEFDGTVISRLTDASTGLSRPGGTVIFSSPGGIIVGSTGLFDVGNLVLTSLNVVADANGNFINPNGGFQFELNNGELAPNAAVVTQSGARIIANSENSFVALVAPVVQHQGSARVNGSVAYIAGEQVQFSVAQGLFDIVVPVGSDNATPIVHTGSTGGPASTGGTDNHGIYLVAVPKNQAITVLLEGSAGYDPAVSASVENGVIVLAAGYNVFGGQIPDDTENFGGPFEGLSSDISINGGNYTSDVVGRATHNAIAAATEGNPLSLTGSLSLQAISQSSLIADPNSTITIGGDANITADRFSENPDETVPSSFDNVGGTASILARDGSSITIDGNVTVSASAGFIGGEEENQGGNAQGGTVIVEGNGGDISIGGDLNVIASATGGAGFVQGGEGRGGFISVVATQGSLSIAGDFAADASGFGGVGDDADPVGGGAEDGAAGGDGFGGNIAVEAASGGAIGLNDAVLIAIGQGGVGGAGSAGPFGGGNGGAGGAGTGGFIEARSTGGTLTLTSDGATRILAQGLGGAGGAGGATSSGSGGTGGAGGAATGGEARLISRSGAVDADDVDLEGNAIGGDGGAGGSGGSTGDGGAGGAGGIAFGGGARLDAFGGVIATGFATVTSNAAGGTGGDGGFGITDGNGGNGGNAIAGAAIQNNFTRGAYVITEGGNLTVAGADIQSIGFGGNGGEGANGGSGGDSLGGSTQFVSLAGTLRATDLVELDSSAFGGAGGAGLGGGLTGGNGGSGGDGTGGLALLSAQQGATAVIDAVDVSVFSTGTGGQGGAGGGADSSGGTGGDGGDGGTGNGGTADIFSQSGTMTLGNADLSASGSGGAGGIGGDAPSPGGTGGGGGTGGPGNGGAVIVAGSTTSLGSTLTLGDVVIESSGLTGAGGDGGSGTSAGGAAGGTSATQGGLVRVSSDQNPNTGATTSLTAGDVDITATGDSGTQIVVSARRAPATFDSLSIFGRGVLRSTTFASEATLGVNGDVSIDVDSDLYFYTFGTGLIDVGGAIQLDTPQSIVTDEIQGGAGATTSNIRTGSLTANAGVDFRGSTTTITADGDVAIAAVGGVTIGTADSGGSIDIDAGGAVDAGTLTAVGDVTVDPTTIDIDSVTAGGDITLDASGDITVGFAQAGDDFVATAGGAFTGTTVIATGDGPDNDASTPTLIGGNIDVFANDDIRVDNGDAADDIRLTSVEANVNSAVLLAAGGDLTINAGADTSLGVDINLAVANAGGVIDLTATGSLTGNILTADGDISANLGADATVETMVSGGSVLLFADGAVDLGTVNAALDVIVDPDTVVIDSVTAGGDIALVADSFITVDFAQAGDDFTAFSGGGFNGGTIVATGLGTDTEAGTAFEGSSISVDANGDLRLDNGTAPTNIELSSSTGSIFSSGTLTANQLTANAAADLALNDVDVVADLNLATANGGISGNSFTSDGDITLTSNADISLATGNAGGFFLASATGAASFGTINAVLDIVLDADSINATTAIAGGDVGLTADGDIALGFAQAGDDFTADAGGAFSANAVTTTGLGADSEGGSGALAGSNIKVDAVGNLRVNNGDAADSMQLTSTGGDILSGVAGSDSPGTLTAGADILADAANDILIGDAQAGTDVTLDAGRDVVARDLRADGTVSVTAGNDITFRDMVTQVGDVILRPGGDLTSTGLLDVGGSLDIVMNGNIDFNDVEAGANILLTSNLGSISIGTADAGGFIFITTSNSDPSLAGFTAGTLTAGGDIETDIAGATQIASATAGGEIDFSSEGDLVAGTLRSNYSTTLESRAGDVSVTSVTANLANDPSDPSLQGFAATAIDGNVTVGSATADNIGLGAGGAVTAGNLVSDNLLLVFAGDDVDLGSVSAGGRFYVSDPATAIALDVFGDEDITLAQLLAALDSTSQGRSGGDVVVNGPVQAGSIAIRAVGDGIFASDVTSGPVLVDVFGNAAFGGVVAAPTIAVISSDVDIGASGRLGDQSTESVTLTVGTRPQQPTPQTVLGGSTEGQGYTLTDAEADRITAGTLRIVAPATGTAANRPADVLVRDLSLDAARIDTFELITPGIARVEGGLLFAGAGAQNVMEIRANQRLEVVNPTGSIRLRDAAGMPAGTLNLVSRDIWSASQGLLGQLLADPAFAGRDDALRNNDGPVEPRGYIEAADVSLAVGNSLFVQNSGTAAAFAGITVTQDTLVVTPTGNLPISVFAFGRRINPDGSFVTNATFFEEVEFAQGQAGYTDESQFNLCIINTRVCSGGIDTPVPGGSDIIEDPVDGSDDVALAPTITNELVDSSFSQEPLIEEPVTSGADSILWDCDRDDDGDCDEDDSHG